MAGRSLRSRTAEAQEENQELAAGERDPANSDYPTLSLASASETPEQDTIRPQEAELGPQSQVNEVSEQSDPTQPVSVDSTNQLQKMLLEFFASVRADLGSHREEIQESVRSELSSHREEIQASVRADMSQVRSDIRAENEKLLQSFEAQTREIRKEVDNKLESEARRVSQLVSQVQTETASELVAVKQQLQSISSEFDSRLDQANASTQLVINELADQMQEHRSEMSNQMVRQKESLENLSQATTQELGRQFDLVNAKVLALESKLNEMPVRQTLATEARVVVQDAASLSAGPANDPATEPDGTEASGGLVGETVSCTHQPAPCNTLSSDSSMNECVVHANTENVSLLGYLSNSELPLPLYDDATETNPVFHLRRLDEFINFRNVPKPLRLAVACRSIVGHIGKQWVEAVMHNVCDYEAFKKAFLNTWWSTSRQSLVKCTLYQAKYDRRSGLSLSGHFLKHVTMASYLNPRPSDGELIEAIRAHYPIGVQRAMLTNQLQTIEQALDLLKRVELMEQSENHPRPPMQTQNSNPNRPGNNPHRSEPRGQNQAQVRQVQFFSSRNRSNRNRRRNRRNYESERDGEPPEGSSGPLNPNATPYQGRQEQNNRSDNHSGNR